VALRTNHRLAGHDSVGWHAKSFGIPSDHPFPDWSAGQRYLLNQAGISPPTVELEIYDVPQRGGSGNAMSIGS
jgi:hypothetical protein